MKRKVRKGYCSNREGASDQFVIPAFAGMTMVNGSALPPKYALRAWRFFALLALYEMEREVTGNQ